MCGSLHQESGSGLANGMAKAIDAGSVGINCTSPTGAHDMPFGGYKPSGVGREG